MSSPNTSDIGSNSTAVSSSTPSNILLRDLVPSRHRFRPPTPSNRSNSNEDPAPEYSQSTLQRNPWMGISSTPPPGFCSFSLQHFEAGLRFPLAPCYIGLNQVLKTFGHCTPLRLLHDPGMPVDKPTPVIEGEGLYGDQISSITTYRYNPKKILVEEILWLAHLTPAPLQVEGSLVSMVSQARINRRLRAQFEARARATAPPASSLQPTPGASSTPDADIPQVPEPTPIEVGNEETQSRGFRQPQSAIPSISARSQDRPLNEEDLAETSRKRKSRGKSPLRPNSIRTRSQSGEVGLPSEETRLEEERDMNMLRSITECWRTTRLDLRGPDHPIAQLEGEKWVLDWQISRSSAFRTRSGQDSWELYDASCLPCDQAALLHTPFTRMEEHCAHSLIQTANFIRGLTLKCAGFRQNHLLADRTNRELRAQITAFNAKDEEWLRSRSLMEARIKELETQMASEAEKAAAIGEKRAVEIKAADYLMQGFDRCKSQATLLHGFAPGFDVYRLNPCLDANLQPLPDEDDSPAADNDEFFVLLGEIEDM
ncbi:UNVERIFIED_CONTAM: hypothetical protein Sindi_1634900 [Sesamum indicum]